MAVDFQSLLIQAGAREPRSGRGKWGCPVCGKMRVSANQAKGVYHCFTAGCAFSGNLLTLARQLGLKVDSIEWRKRAAEIAKRLYWEERGHALRVRAYKILAEQFREKRREYDELRASLFADSTRSDVVEAGLTAYADLLYLNAELLLVEVLPLLDLCAFLQLSEEYRERRIAETVSRAGVFASGRIHELPEVGARELVSDNAGPAMSEESWQPKLLRGPGHDDTPLSPEETAAQAAAFETWRKKAIR